ncbi:hypothetical protein AVEN_107182-1 [Araneus ventricosus]|uniref:Uncharacterized protein n=1 Tax=Araneus ventricosus TaxID=182803 RepID=A0A4Y2FDY8_ARAVE|nr:hypothetical protein AVEN_107182-1 [Araneus ventricosus]
MFISQHPPLNKGNSFCLVVKTRDSGPKVSGSKLRVCHSGDPEDHATPTFSPTGCPKNHINSIYHYIQQMAALLHKLSQLKVYDHFKARSL